MVLERLASSVLQDAFGKREETKTTYYDEKRTRALAAFNLVPGSYREILRFMWRRVIAPPLNETCCK